jgi:hypothetical protein
MRCGLPLYQVNDRQLAAGDLDFKGRDGDERVRISSHVVAYTRRSPLEAKM